MATFNTYDYQFLIKCLNEGSIIFKSEAIKRLTNLAGSDKKQFFNYMRGVLNQLDHLYREDKEDINFLAITLLNEMVINLISKDNESLIAKRHLPFVVANLGHPVKTNVRKASHSCLLNYLKSYHNFEHLQEAYLKHGFQNENELVQQKSINSFQSLLILEVKYYDWSSQTSRKLFQSLINHIENENLFISKAASQCILSMCKLEGVKQVIPNLSISTIKRLKMFLEEIMPKLNSQMFMVNINQLNKIIQFSQAKSTLFLKEKEKKITEIASSDKVSEEASEQKSEMQEAIKNTNNQRRLEKIRNSMKQEESKLKSQKEQYHGKLFSFIGNEGTLKERTQAVEELLYKIQVSKSKPEFESSIKAILPTLIRMLKDSNPKIVSLILRIIENIIEQISMNQAHLQMLIAVIVEKLSDQKISIRQNVSKVIKELVTKTSKDIWIRELLQNLRKNTNNVLKDETLYLIHYIYEISKKEEIKYPTSDILEHISMFTDDPKTKIKIRTLDCLSAIVYHSKDKDKFNLMMKNKMTSVFYQMYLEKLNKISEEEDKKIQETERKRKNLSDQQIPLETHRTISHERRKQSDRGDREEDNLNISMEVVKKRVSLLKKPRNLLSTQETMSVDNSSHKMIDRSIEDVEIMLPSLYKKTTANRFIAKKAQFSPNKTSQNKASDYLSKEELVPLRDPEKELKCILADLKHSDWKIQFDTTNKLRRLIQFNSEIIVNSPLMHAHTLAIDLVGLIQNLRSSVAKNGLICLNEFILLLGKQIDPEMDLILDKLIKKSADTNIFISAEVQKCLIALSHACTPAKFLQKIANYRESKSLSIKDSVITTLQAMKDVQKIRQKQYTKLAESIGFYLLEPQIEIRNKAKIGIIELCKSLGDWYRALRGRINPNCFKSICQLMTKSPNFKGEELQSQLKPAANRQEYSTISQQKANVFKKDSSQRSQTIEPIPARKRITKVSQFPEEFNEIQSDLELCNSSQWKKRIQSIQRIYNLSLAYPNEFVQFKSATHFIDVICKQMMEPNLKVSTNAMDIFLNIFNPLKILIENNLSVISNSVFSCLSSSKVEVKELAEKCTKTLFEDIQIQYILQYICHGILYSLPRSRIYLTCKLIQMVQYIHESRKQLLFKHIFPLLNKLMEEYKSQLMPHVVNLLSKLYDVMGNHMFSHLTKFKEVRELIDK